MADEYGCGVDFSFKTNPRVVILCGETPISNYQFKQFAGRAQRKDEFPICTVMTTTGEGSADSIRGRIMGVDQQPLKEWEQCMSLFETNKSQLAKVWKVKKKENLPKIKLCGMMSDFKEALQQIKIIP